MSRVSQEKRKYPRLDNNVPIKISSDDLDIVTETRNISCAGAYCRVDKYLEPMTKLKVYLLLPFRKSNKVSTKKIACNGVVVRTESQPGNNYFNVAIYFSDIQQKDRKSIAEFVDAALSRTKNAKSN